MIIIKGVNGSVAVMYPAEGADIDEAVRKFKDSHPGEYLDGYIEYNGKLPERTFRDAWTMSGNKIVVNDNKAMVIHMGRIRKARDIELERLDREQLRYIADPWKPKEIDEQKQILRDLPANVNSLDWPDILPRS